MVDNNRHKDENYGLTEEAVVEVVEEDWSSFMSQPNTKKTATSTTNNNNDDARNNILNGHYCSHDTKEICLDPSMRRKRNKMDNNNLESRAGAITTATVETAITPKTVNISETETLEMKKTVGSRICKSSGEIPITNSHSSSNNYSHMYLQILSVISPLVPIDMIGLANGTFDATGNRIWLGAYLFLEAFGRQDLQYEYDDSDSSCCPHRRCCYCSDYFSPDFAPARCNSQCHHCSCFYRHQLYQLRKILFHEKNIIELGCGTGISGISLLKSKELKKQHIGKPTFVLFTDNDNNALDLCKRNCVINLTEGENINKKNFQQCYSSQYLSWVDDTICASNNDYHIKGDEDEDVNSKTFITNNKNIHKKNDYGKNYFNKHDRQEPSSPATNDAGTAETASASLEDHTINAGVIANLQTPSTSAGINDEPHDDANIDSSSTACGDGSVSFLFDTVIATDVLYYYDSLKPLISTASQMLSKNNARNNNESCERYFVLSHVPRMDIPKELQEKLQKKKSRYSHGGDMEDDHGPNCPTPAAVGAFVNKNSHNEDDRIGDEPIPAIGDGSNTCDDDYSLVEKTICNEAQNYGFHLLKILRPIDIALAFDSDTNNKTPQHCVCNNIRNDNSNVADMINNEYSFSDMSDIGAAILIFQKTD